MKKQHLNQIILFSLILFIVISCTQSNKRPPKGLEGTWLSISQGKGRLGGYGLMTGYFMEIKPGKRIFQFAYSDTSVCEDVLYTDSTIIYEDSNNIMIPYIGIDSIQLAFQPDTTIVTYVKLPFKKTGKVKISEKNLTENEWYLIDSEKEYRVDFIDYDFDIFHYDKSFKLGFNLLDWGGFFGWDIMEFDGHYYLISTSHSNTEPMVYQITDFKNDTISLIHYDDWFTKEFKQVKLVKAHAKSAEEHNQLRSQLIDHQYKLITYDFESQFDDETWDTIPLYRLHRFFKVFGIEKEMTFKFTKDSLFVFNNIGGKYATGAWELSKDNNAINVVIENNPLILLIMKIKMDSNMQLSLNGSQNINKLIGGYQMDKLNLELELIPD